MNDVPNELSGRARPSVVTQRSSSTASSGSSSAPRSTGRDPSTPRAHRDDGSSCSSRSRGGAPAGHARRHARPGRRRHAAHRPGRGAAVGQAGAAARSGGSAPRRRALGQGRLDTRLPVHGQDELAELTSTFNDTAAALERSVGAALAGGDVPPLRRRRLPRAAHPAHRDDRGGRHALRGGRAAAQPTPAEAVRLVLREIERLRGLVEHLIEVEPVRRGHGDAEPGAGQRRRRDLRLPGGTRLERAGAGATCRRA